MNGQSLLLDFLIRMKVLVQTGKRHFVRRNRNGVSYVQQLARLRLSSPDEAWDCVMELGENHYLSGPEIDRGEPASTDKVVWTFIMEINGIITYIKLKDETERRGCVCLSFHEAEY